MTLYKNRYRVESARCASWNYSWNGWYFVTICTGDRQPLFGEIDAEKMHLSAAGQIVQDMIGWHHRKR